MKRLRMFVYVLFVTTAITSVLWAQGSDKVYFFRGSQYLRYDIPSDRVDPGYPLPILGNWPGWPSSWNYVDGAINWGNGKAYFFRGSEYLSIDISTGVVDPGYPQPILGNLPGWPDDWDHVDATVNWGNGKAYFFRGSEYLRYDIPSDGVDPGYPQPILCSGCWNGWPTSWRNYTQAGVNWGNNKVYFFRGSEYLRFDIPSNQVDPGYPQPILGNWPGWPPSWNYTDAAIRWGVGGFGAGTSPTAQP